MKVTPPTMISGIGTAKVGRSSATRRHSASSCRRVISSSGRPETALASTSGGSAASTRVVRTISMDEGLSGAARARGDDARTLGRADLPYEAQVLVARVLVVERD